MQKGGGGLVFFVEKGQGSCHVVPRLLCLGFPPTFIGKHHHRMRVHQINKADTEMLGLPRFLIGVFYQAMRLFSQKMYSFVPSLILLPSVSCTVGDTIEERIVTKPKCLS